MLDYKSLIKEKGNWVILAHYYQTDDIQEIADYVGDSYYLSKVAKDLHNKNIIFCGVQFMAESAHVLSPHSAIHLAHLEAGCPMADMADLEKIKLLKEKYPNSAFVCYINSPVSVKALCDVCVTSSNAVTIINKLEEKEIVFLPDQNLGRYIAQQCPDKKVVLYEGYCIIHHAITGEQVLRLKEKHKGAPVLVHPECQTEVLELADFVGSTGAILKESTERPEKNQIIITEEGIGYALRKNNPDKVFVFPDEVPMICEDMKKTTLEDVYTIMEGENRLVQVDEETREKALKCLEKMHALGGE